MVRLLLQMGSDPLKATSEGITALMLACEHGYDRAAKVLIDAGAQIDAVTKDGKSVLEQADEHVHTNVVVMLLKDLEDELERQGWTPRETCDIASSAKIRRRTLITAPPWDKDAKH